MLLVAMSALQGRPQRAAFDALAALDVDGIQLTPGNLPEPGFAEHVARSRLARRGHHGFDFARYRRPVYDESGRAPRLPPDWSIHPPPVDRVPFDAFLAHAREREHLCEIMYPGHHLGSGAELEAAMDAGLRLAVDVSHLYIQECAGVVSARARRRLFAYDRVCEVHVSHNGGARDGHQPLRAETPHLDWARERLAAGVPVVFESYLHRLDHDARRRQIALLRGGA